jgi:hypothetical protein
MVSSEPLIPTKFSTCKTPVKKHMTPAAWQSSVRSSGPSIEWVAAPGHILNIVRSCWVQFLIYHTARSLLASSQVPCVDGITSPLEYSYSSIWHMNVNENRIVVGYIYAHWSPVPIFLIKQWVQLPYVLAWDYLFTLGLLLFRLVCNYFCHTTMWTKPKWPDFSVHLYKYIWFLFLQKYFKKNAR